MKASEFIRLWFLAYLWSFPKAYCSCVHVQLQCSYPASRSEHGRRYFYFLTGAAPLYVIHLGSALPSWALQAAGPLAGSCTSPGLGQQHWGGLKNTLQEFKTFPPSSSSPVFLRTLWFTPASTALKIHRLREKQEASSDRTRACGKRSGIQQVNAAYQSVH